MAIKNETGAQAKPVESVKVNLVDLSKEIDASISALKKVTKWPAKGKGTPPYKDESATLYLQVLSKKKIPALPGPSNFLKAVKLPHPLSYKRDVVCFVVFEDKVEEALKEIGVQGKIKAYNSRSLRDITATWDELANDYDTHITDITANDAMMRTLLPRIDKLYKAFAWAPSSRDVDCDHDFRIPLAKSMFFISPSRDAYLIKVAHTGHTDEQIKENIEFSLNGLIGTPYWFPQGLNHFKGVMLKTGTSKAVPIYVNDGEVIEEPARWVIPVGNHSTSTKLKKRKFGTELLQKLPKLPPLEAPSKKSRQGMKRALKKKKRADAAAAAAAAGDDEAPAEVATANKAAAKKKKNKKSKSKESSLEVAKKSVGGAMSNAAGKNNKRKSAEAPLEVPSKKQKSANGATPVKAATTPATPNTGGKNKKNKQKHAESPLETVRKNVNGGSPATPNAAGKKNKNKNKMATPSPGGKKLKLGNLLPNNNGSQKKKQKSM